MLIMKNVKNSINQFLFITIGAMFGFTIGKMVGGGFDKPTMMLMVGVSSAFISIFIDFLIQPEQIFGFWGRGLEWFKSLKPNPFKFMAKPLGGCMYCMNVWVTFFVFLATRGETNIGWWWFILVASISHVTLAITERNVNA
jgi:hypothetical protein